MAGDADAATHRVALHEGDIGFWEFRDLGIEAVFLAPEAATEFEIACAPPAVHLGDVAARAEGAVTGGVDHDKLDSVIAPPCVERGLDCIAHVPGERIERLRAVQRYPARAAGLADQDVGHFAMRPRATIRRMISFVPSRIW